MRNQTEKSLLPGHTALHRMLYCTKSIAIDLLKPITAAFVVPYTHRLAAPVRIK